MTEEYPEFIDITPTLLNISSEENINFHPRLTEPSAEDLKSKEIILGPRKQKLTLILDIDNTILYSMPTELDSSGNIISFDVIQRPHLKEFLGAICRLYEIILFTAGSELYASKIWDIVDPEHKYISAVLGNNSCVVTEEGYFVKNLRIFADRDLKKIVIVDDHEYSYSFQASNGIRVSSFEGEKFDEELVLLGQYLEQLVGCEDVRLENEEKLYKRKKIN